MGSEMCIRDRAILFLVLTGIVVFGVLRPAVKAIGAAPKVLAEIVPDGGAKPALEAPPPGGGTPASLEGVRQIAKSDPVAVANVVKTWVGESKG